MTNRLKRKLNDLGVDPTGSRVSESFCLIGTPLPPLEKTKDKNEFVPLWKQDVRDEKGRRRLHGAFTGGFSAGYFNTVGSKEGWTPSNFVSSRSGRAKTKATRPEDYMDEEDLAEMREGQKLVDVTEETDILGGTQAELRKKAGTAQAEDDSMTAALRNLMPTVKDSVGATLLKKMGWKPGQGVGPRVTWEQWRRSGGLSTSDVDEHAEARKHTYPPRDTNLPTFIRKDNLHGLGYESGLGLTDIVDGNASTTNRKPKGPQLSEGFGLGALNDADDDDLEVYDTGRSGHTTRLAYDNFEPEEKNISLSSSSLKNKTGPLQKTDAQTFHDRRVVLSGFRLSEKPVAEDPWFPVPDIPKDWSPDPRRVWVAEESEVLKSADTNRMTADQRGSMLGETPLPSAPRSVFEYLSDRDRSRLQNMANKTPSEHQPPVETAIPATSVVTTVEPYVAKAALSGFQPFTAEPAKQARYTAYLQSQASSDHPPLKPMPGQRPDMFQKELADFASAATIFKPATGVMANRFTSATIVEKVSSAQEGLHQPRHSALKDQDQDVDMESIEPNPREVFDPKVHAARTGMFGPLTRETKSWIPAKLLCKRFGIKHPEPVVDEDPLTDLPSEMAAGSSWESQINRPPLQPSSSFNQDENKLDTASNGPEKRDLANLGLGEDDSQGQDTLTYQRPPIDIFKAIFASDDEESDDEEEVNMALTEAPATLTSDPAKAISGVPASTAISGVVDIGTFKPTFVPRSERSKPKDAVKASSGSKKAKTLPTVSFGDDQLEGESGPLISIKNPSKKKRKKERKKVENEDWVEKPVPDSVRELVDVPMRNTIWETSLAQGVTEGPVRGRRRAIDFMD